MHGRHTRWPATVMKFQMVQWSTTSLHGVNSQNGLLRHTRKSGPPSSNIINTSSTTALNQQLAQFHPPIQIQLHSRDPLINNYQLTIQASNQIVQAGPYIWVEGVKKSMPPPQLHRLPHHPPTKPSTPTGQHNQHCNSHVQSTTRSIPLRCPRQPRWPTPPSGAPTELPLWPSP